MHPEIEAAAGRLGTGSRLPACPYKAIDHEFLSYTTNHHG